MESAANATATRAVAGMSNTGAIDQEAALLQAMERTVQESLQYYVYDNAIFYAERLFELRPDHHHLHLLADCYARGGDAQTAYSLLHHHYPFFPPSAAAASAAGGGSAEGAGSSTNNNTSSNNNSRTAGVLRGAGALSGTPPPPPSSSAPSAHKRVASATSGYGPMGGAAPILPARLTHASTRPPHAKGATMASMASVSATEIAARWCCQYLLGVLCYQTQRYAEGRRVLLELRQVCAVAQRAAAAPRAFASRAAMAYSGGPEAGTLEAMMAMYAATPPSGGSAAETCLARIAEVEYWLAMCERRLSLDQSADTFLRAVRDNPRLFAALEAYLATASPPSESCVQLYQPAAHSPTLPSTPPPPQQPQQQQQPFMSPPLFFAPPATGAETSPRRPSAALQGASYATRKRPASAHLEPDSGWQEGAEAHAEAGVVRAALYGFLLRHARASYLLHMYRCAEVRQWLVQHCAMSEDEGDLSTGGALLGPPQGRSGTGNAMGLWARTQFALAHFHDGNMAESAAAFAALLQRAPWRLNERALIYYSTALWQLKDESTLGALAQQLTETLPLSVVTLCVVANMFSLAKEPQEALTMLQRATQVDAAAAYAYALRGYELLYLDRKAEAAEAFKTAIGVDRNLYVAYAGLGEMHLREEEILLARRYFRQAIGINPLPTIMNRYAASFHARDATRDDLDDALRIYQSSIQLHPNNLAARLQRADVLLRLGRYEEARKELNALIHVCAKEAMWHVMMARCMQCLGQPKLAIHYYSHAMKLDPRREGYIRSCMEKLGTGAREEVATM